jgi:acetolactate synthase I/II/III large subunit
MELLSGGDMVARFLADKGVECIYGYPGGAALHIYDALYRYNIKHVLVRHEQAAVHMADGYARATGKPGVVLVTSGPGATNTITGIATAYMDSIPMVVLSGQVPNDLIGTDAFQETDMLGISRPVVKHNFMIKNAADIPVILQKAFYIASTGKKGPVVVDIPKDVTEPGKTFSYEYVESVSLRSYNPAFKGDYTKITKACQLLVQARQPIVYGGGGTITSNAHSNLYKIVKKLNLPITHTLMGLGAYPSTDKQFLGMLGMHGTYQANCAMHNADLVIAMGARFDDRVTNKVSEFCPNAKIIHIDIDPANIAKIIKPYLYINGDLNTVLADMLAILDSMQVPDLKLWWQQIAKWQEKKSLAYTKDNKVIKPQQVIESLYSVTKGEAYITTDVGQHQMFAAQYYKFDKPNRWITSGGLGTMGFGLPAAMGVSMAYPKSQVACITGDGSIQMNIQELSTCKQYGLPVKIINLNNRYLGMVKQWQDLYYESRYSHSYMDSLPDFVKLVESYGHIGILVTTPDELEIALEKSFTEYKDKLVFLDIHVDPTEHVYPMQIRGGSMQDMLFKKTE